MVRITEQLIRKKSEHNESVIGTLEELSLHQEDVEKIEHIHNWCKDLQILYLQSNLIPKIENLNKLKKLQYLNLAINNIEKVENLQGCESLEKLDLTLNFIGDIESIASLRDNIHLKLLFLTGNPCTDYAGYRDYVVAKLPQLQSLDDRQISRSERLKALQTLEQTEKQVKEAQRKYFLSRAQQKDRLLSREPILDDDEYWKSTSEHAPETRVEMSTRRRKCRGEDQPEPEKKPLKFFAKDGRPLNINQAKLKFTYSDEDPREIILDLAIYKYLDTNLIQVDLEPTYVRVMFKGKVFQFVLPEEICVDKSICQRSQTTGHLLIRMPKVNYKEAVVQKADKPKDERRHKYLEVGHKDESLDFSKIVEQGNKSSVDDPDIPPLEWG